MTARMTRKLVTFLHPFHLDEVEHELPAGSYEVETEEERLDGATFYAYRRIATVFVVRPSESATRTRNLYITIDPSSLEAALERDKVRAADEQTAWNREISAYSTHTPAAVIELHPPGGVHQKVADAHNES